MKQLLLTALFSLSAYATQATSIMTTTSFLPVDSIETGLREVAPNSYRGPIVIRNTNVGVEISFDNNVCSVDGMCTRMAPTVFEATIVYQGEDNDNTYFEVVPNLSAVMTNDTELLNPITVAIAKHKDFSTITTAANVYAADNYVWMVKYDGSITCDNLTGIALSDMYLELSQAGIDVSSMSKAVTGEIMPMVCGIKSGNLNAYLVNTEAVRFVTSMGYVVFRSSYPNGQILN